jgi:hypothetical protein
MRPAACPGSRSWNACGIIPICSQRSPPEWTKKVPHGTRPARAAGPGAGPPDHPRPCAGAGTRDAGRQGNPAPAPDSEHRRKPSYGLIFSLRTVTDGFPAARPPLDGADRAVP